MYDMKGKNAGYTSDYGLTKGTLYQWWRHKVETFSALLAICAGNSPVTGEFPSQRPVTQSLDVFFHLCLNKRLSKQSWGWWYETPSHSIWRHPNAYGGVLWVFWGIKTEYNLHMYETMCKCNNIKSSNSHVTPNYWWYISKHAPPCHFANHFIRSVLIIW